MNYKNIISAFSMLLVVLTIGFSSCKGLDLDPIDPNVIQDFRQDEVFTKIYATLGLSGQQGPAGKGDVSGIDEGTSAFVRLVFNLNELTTDHAICAWGDPGIDDMNFNKWTSSLDQVGGLYGRLGFNITLCNHFLERTEGGTDAKTLKQRAEVRFMRALNYYYMMDMFANVPFAEKVLIGTKPQQIQRADLFKFVEKELLESEPDMFEPRQAPYYRSDKAASWLLLSRLYLNAEVYTGTPRWADAATYAKKVMNSAYRLNPSYSQLFMADNAGAFDGSTINTAPQEIILPVAADGIKTISYGGSLFLIASTHTSDMPSWGSSEGWGGNRARAALVKKFFPTGELPTTDETELATNLPLLAEDDRAMFFGVNRTVNITTVSKFKEGLSVQKFTNVRADGKPSRDITWVDSDFPLMRVAEAYLTFAEATLRAGGSTAEALKAINDVRARANAVNWTSISTSDLDKVLDEWSREFYFEGRRRIDLVRFNKYGGSDYAWDWKGGSPNGSKFNEIYNIFPIPASDLNANSNLVQNPGY